MFLNVPVIVLQVAASHSIVYFCASLDNSVCTPSLCGDFPLYDKKMCLTCVFNSFIQFLFTSFSDHLKSKYFECLFGIFSLKKDGKSLCGFLTSFSTSC